tara:strand:+ start:2802 stop:3725 length:924 start_codon:yes stop_codon:yes gene_type:complete
MTLEIISYHYVRPIKNSNYPNVKGLEIEGFLRQMDFFKKNKTVITTQQVKDFFLKGTKIPKNSIWLTFDDGYKDHINFVAPILENFNFDAIFFPVINTYAKNILLDVNAIHYIIAKSECENQLIDRLKYEMANRGLNSEYFENLWVNTNKKKMFDSEKISFFKIVLQHNLSFNVRKGIINKLFKDFVGKSQKQFSKELYMNKQDLKYLVKKGFSVGSHTTSHQWLTKLSYQEQKYEIINSINELKKINSSEKNWILCFPHGLYNQDTLKILDEYNFSLGLKNKGGMVTSRHQNRFELPRCNTNDFPQ